MATVFYRKVLGGAGGATVYSYDISQEMREIARKNGANVLDENELIDRKFDCVVLKLVIQFIDDIDSFLGKIRTHVKSGGGLIISVPGPHRTALQYNRQYGQKFIYSNQMNNSEIKFKMLHRPFGEIITAFKNNNFLMSEFEEVMDDKSGDLGDILPKRLNIRFEKK